MTSRSTSSKPRSGVSSSRGGEVKRGQKSRNQKLVLAFVWIGIACTGGWRRGGMRNHLWQERAGCRWVGGAAVRYY